MGDSRRAEAPSFDRWANLRYTAGIQNGSGIPSNVPCAARKHAMVTDQLTFEQVVRAVHRWRPEQKAALLTTLQHEQAAPELTREQLIAELNALRAAGAFDHTVSLRDQYPSPALDGVSDQQLRAAIREAATEYKTDMLEILVLG